jgi:hypothetical protein
VVPLREVMGSSVVAMPEPLMNARWDPLVHVMVQEGPQLVPPE